MEETMKHTIKRQENGMKDYSTVTVSLNMRDYQALKKAAYRNEEDWKKRREEEEAYEGEIAALKHKVRMREEIITDLRESLVSIVDENTSLKQRDSVNESRLRAYEYDAKQAGQRADDFQERYDNLYNYMKKADRGDVTRERKVTVKYLREVADSIEKLKEDENLGLFAVET
jgi:regulator of replication initiation timing